MIELVVSQSRLDGRRGRGSELCMRQGRFLGVSGSGFGTGHVLGGESPCFHVSFLSLYEEIRARLTGL
jgi:hypothetical protein